MTYSGRPYFVLFSFSHLPSEFVLMNYTTTARPLCRMVVGPELVTPERMICFLIELLVNVAVLFSSTAFAMLLYRTRTFARNPKILLWNQLFSAYGIAISRFDEYNGAFEPKLKPCFFLGLVFLRQHCGVDQKQRLFGLSMNCLNLQLRGLFQSALFPYSQWVAR